MPPMPPALSPWIATGHLVLDVGGGHHGYGPLGPGKFARRLLIRRRPSSTRLLIAGFAFSFFRSSSTHSKASLSWDSENVILFYISSQKHRRCFRAFSWEVMRFNLKSRLVED